MKVELTSLNTSSSVEPIDKIRLTTESANYQEVVDYGDDNLLPDLLLELIYESTTHQSILEFKKNAVLGNGLAVNRNGKNIKDLVRGCSWEDFIERTVYDMIVFEGFAWQVIWNKAGTAINGIYHQPFHQVRSGNYNEEGEIDQYHIAKDWKYRINKKRIAKFNPETAKEDGVQLYYFKTYTAINDFYPIPSYFSAINYIKVEKELAKFYNGTVNNGMFPSLIMEIKSQMPDELKADFIKKLRDSYEGGRNANKVITMFSDQDTQSVQITPIEAVSNDNLFDSLNEIVTNRIINAHRIPRSLVGVEKNLGLSSNAEELRMSFEYFNNTVIKPIQQRLIAAFKEVATVNFKSINMEFVSMDLVSQSFTEQTMLSILTRDELRAVIGYEPIDQVTVETPIEEPATGEVITTYNPLNEDINDNQGATN